MEVSLTLPDWAEKELLSLPRHLRSLEERMRAVIRFSRLNFERGTGGPFAAGIFEQDSGRLVTIGVNRVPAILCSSAHAEVVALSLAQRLLGTYDLGGPGLPGHQLVVNGRPCAMCFGATLWSGVRSLAIAADGDAIERIAGFDEGPIHPEWRSELGKRGIELVEGVLESDALSVFRDFASSGALVYNPRRG